MFKIYIILRYDKYIYLYEKINKKRIICYNRHDISRKYRKVYIKIVHIYYIYLYFIINLSYYFNFII